MRVILALISMTLSLSCEDSKRSQSLEKGGGKSAQCTIQDSKSAPEGFEMANLPGNSISSLQEIYDKAGFGAIREVCESPMAVFFVGNGEPIGTMTWSEVVSNDNKKIFHERQEARDELFYRAILKANKDLRSSLAVNDCRKFYKENNPAELPKLYQRSQVILLSVLDGPLFGDSEIQLDVFSWTKKEEAWHWESKVRNLIWHDGSIEQSLEPFELNLPKSLSDIMESSFPIGDRLSTINQHAKRNFFIFKTHGGLLVRDESTVPDITRITPLLSSDVLPIMLIDSTGVEGPLESDLFAPIWLRDTACKIYEKHNLNALYEQGSCGKPIDPRDETVPLTAGVDGAACNTAGSEKSALYDMARIAPLLRQGDSDIRPHAMDGYLKLGSAVTYNNGQSGISQPTNNLSDESVPSDGNLSQKPTIDDYTLGQGLHLWELELGNVPINMVLMDSCYGSNNIIDAFHRGGSGNGTNIALFNAKPLYFDLIDYSHLTLSQYLALTSILSPSETYAEQLGELSQKAIENLRENGLAAKPHEGKSSYRRLNIDIQNIGWATQNADEKSSVDKGK